MNVLDIIVLTILICFGVFVAGIIVHFLGYNKGFDDMLGIYKTFSNKWRSIDDELPEIYLDDEGIELDFAVWGKGYTTSVTAHFDGTKFYFDCYDGSKSIMKDISHWQPLPEPPKMNN